MQQNLQDIHKIYSSVIQNRPVTVKNEKPVCYKTRVLWLIFLLSIFRMVLASTIQLSNDESYYWLYSQDLKSNYFDHPPMVAIWIRLFTANLLLQDQEFFLRLGSIISCSMATWFIFKTVSLIHTRKAGWLAAIFYNASFYAGLTAGIYIMPDSPQMVFWTLGMWSIAKLIGEELRWTNWLLFGISAGLCIMSKIHGVFLPLGLSLFIILYKREWLLTPQPYVSMVIAALIASPILIWNLKYGFITYEFHTQRVTIDTTIDAFSFVRELFSQIFFNNPVTTALVLLGLFSWRKFDFGKSKALVVFNLIGLPFAVCLLFIALFRDTTLPHWSGPAYVSLIPLAAISLVKKYKTSRFPIQAKWALGIFLFVLTAWSIIINFYPGTFGNKKSDTFGKYDISLDLYGWEKASEQFAVLYKQDVSNGMMLPNSPLVSTYWWGAHVEYYFCRPYGIQMIAMGSIRDLREYWWMNETRIRNVNLQNAYCIMPADESYAIPLKFYKKVELAKIIEIKRGGLPAHRFNVYRLKGWIGVAKTRQRINNFK